MDGFTRVVPLDEIKGNDYNLNVTLRFSLRKKPKRLTLLESERKSIR